MTKYNNSMRSPSYNLVFIYGSFSIGASGDPTIVNTNGFSNRLTITRNGTGNYSIGLADKFKNHLCPLFTYIYNGVPTVYINPTSPSYSQAANTITFQFYKGSASSGPALANVSADPDNGAVINFCLTMKEYS